MNGARQSRGYCSDLMTVAANQRFAKISQLPAFTTMQAALTEQLSRGGSSSQQVAFHPRTCRCRSNLLPPTERSLIDATAK